MLAAQVLGDAAASKGQARIGYRSHCSEQEWRRTLADSTVDTRKPAEPGPGHNIATHAPKEEPVWERWTKKRVFVRALEGTYGELVRELFTQPRVYHSKDQKWKGGPTTYGKKIINPQAAVERSTVSSRVASKLRRWRTSREGRDKPISMSKGGRCSK